MDENLIINFANSWAAILRVLRGEESFSLSIARDHLLAEGGQRLARVGLSPDERGADELESQLCAILARHLTARAEPSDRPWPHLQRSKMRLQALLPMGTGFSVLEICPMWRQRRYTLAALTTLDYRQASCDQRTLYARLDQAEISTHPGEDARQELVTALGCGGAYWRGYRPLPRPGEAEASAI